MESETIMSLEGVQPQMTGQPERLDVAAGKVAARAATTVEEVSPVLSDTSRLARTRSALDPGRKAPSKRKHAAVLALGKPGPSPGSPCSPRVRVAPRGAPPVLAQRCAQRPTPCVGDGAEGAAGGGSADSGGQGEQTASESRCEEISSWALEAAESPPRDTVSRRPARSEAQFSGTQEDSAMRTVALDLGARQIAYCEIAAGKVLARGTVRSMAGLKDLLGPNTPRAKVAFEACREAWHVHDTLEQWGHQPVMLDTTRTKRIGVGQHRRKNDRLDAEALAHALARGAVPQAHVLSVARRELRAQLQVRATLVASRAEYVVVVRGHARARGCRIPACDTDRFVERFRTTPKSNAALQPLVAPLLPVLALLDAQIAAADQKLVAWCTREPEIVRLATVPGVALIVAAAFVAVIDDPKRFRNAHQVESYIGLVPSEDSSGGTDKKRLGHITLHGNPMLRSLLVEAAQSLLNSGPSNDPLRLWALQLAARRSKRSIAVVALARRLCGVLWALWRDGSTYQPERVGMQSAQGKEVAANQTLEEAAALARAAKKFQRVRTRATSLARRRAQDVLEVTTGS